MFLLYVLVSVGFCTIRASTINPEITHAQNWWDARSYCRREFRSDLLTPDPVFNISHLKKGRKYWVGALETYRWKWKGGSYLNEYRGFAALPVQESVHYRLSNNSVNACFKTCKKDGLIGLSGEKCYCYVNENVHQCYGDADSCPGNPEDKCGNKTGMSVYKTDEHFSDDDNGRCAVVHMSKVEGSAEVQILSSKCSRQLYSLCSAESRGNCNGEICKSQQRSNWTSANQGCHLITVMNRTKANLTVLLEEKSKKDYWIGLQKIISRRWINGTAVRIHFQHTVAKDPKCLAVLRNRNTVQYKWLPCMKNYSALCEAEDTPFAPPTIEVTQDAKCQKTLATETTAGSTVPLEEMPKVEEPTTDSTGGSTKGSDRAVEDETKQKNKGEIPMYVGLGVVVGLVLLLAALLALTAFFKSKKHKRNTSHRGTNTGQGNLESPPDKEEQQNDDGTYDTIRPQEIREHPDGCYNHLGVFNENTYDIAGFIPGNPSNNSGIPKNKGNDTTRPQQTTGDTEGTYNHLGGLNCHFVGTKPGNLPHDSRSSQSKSNDTTSSHHSRDSEGCYSHLGELHEGTYDCAGIRRDKHTPTSGTPQNSIYDTSRSQPISGDAESCYNHLGGLNEGTYDIAGIKSRSHSQITGTAECKTSGDTEGTYNQLGGLNE